MLQWKLDKGSILLPSVAHLGVAVKSAEKSTKFISSIWDIGTPDVIDYETRSGELVVGKPFKVRLVFIKLGTHLIELLQPLDEQSIWSDFIRDKGEGIHHIAYGVSNYDEIVAKLQKQGQTLLLAAVFEGCRWCYLNTSPGGMVIEIREECSRL
ncbi:MAG: VOC family protein [Dehalococcoidales bacterium]|nr:VOC family protein [Dehalococcoidales bacterium]